MSSTAQIQKEIFERLAAWRREKLKDFDDASLAWLAVVPAWTERLAELASFPLGSLSLEEFLSRAEGANICERETRDHLSESTQHSARALAALWPRFDEKQKQLFAPILRERAQALPAGPDQKRILRYVELYETAGSESLLSRLRGSSKSPKGDPAESGRAMNVLLGYLGELKTQTPSSLDVSWLTQVATKLRGQEFIQPAISALSQIPDPEVAVRVLAPLTAAISGGYELFNYARELADKLHAPETRARLLLSMIPYGSPDLQNWLHVATIKSINQIDDPVSRAFSFLNAGPVLNDESRSYVVQELLRSTREIPEPSLRATILVGALPLLNPEQRVTVGKEAVAIARDLPNADQAIGVLETVARAFAEIGEMDGARHIASVVENPAGRVKILLEILPRLNATDEVEVESALAALNAPALEEVLSTLSPEAGAALAARDASLIAQTAGTAARAGRFAVAAKIATIYTERPRKKLFTKILDTIRAIPVLQLRLEAVTQVIAHVPDSLLETVGHIAAEVQSSRRFSVPDSMRADIIQYVQDQQGSTFLLKEVLSAGKGILDACKKEQLDLPPATPRWAQIAALCANVSEAAAFVAAQIRAAVEADNTVEALEILNTTTPLAKIVGGELEPAVVVGRHRIQIAFRQAADERHLARYLPRQEQIDAFNELLSEPDGPDTRWALHYLGMGGVGKTMLLRHIMARLAVKDDIKLPTARVDFDHISPDYPARKPGDLLASLAEELRFYGGQNQESRFIEFTNQLNAVHGALSNEPPPNNPLQNIQTDVFRRLLDKFAALLNDLPKPVIIILDTCEELAKLEPAGAILPSVEASFNILEALHASAPGIRVVFAGRRLLARAGDLQSDGTYRWAVKADTLSEHNKLLPLEKNYLRLHVVRGFTDREAADYFNTAQLQLDKDRAEAILLASPDSGNPAEIEWQGEEPHTSGDTQRYNPFDLFLYTDWILEDPKVTADMISSSETDPYVEVRIIGRIDGAVSKALPAAVLLRRFDVEMLRDVVPGGEEALRRVYRDLGSQEWIDYQQDILQVDRNLLPRLERYFDHEKNRYLLDSARQALRPSLEAWINTALTAEDPFSMLTIANVDAALRLLPGGQAAALWDDIDRKVADIGNWSWADNVCAYLLSENNAAGSDTSVLRAAVRATRAAVALHSPPYEPVLRWWHEVAEKAKNHPDEATQKWLEARAQIALGPLTDVHVQLVQEWRADPWRYRQLVAGFAASLERQSDLGVMPLPESNFAYDETVPVEIRLFLACLYARGAVGTELVELCKALAGSPVSARQCWADWRTPANLVDRVRLELLRGGRENAISQELNATTEELQEWADEAAQRLDNADSERLLSRIIQLTLEYDAPLAYSIAALVKAKQLYDPNRRPDCPAHREVPPLFASAAEALLVRGGGGEVPQLIKNALHVPNSSQDSEAASAEKLINWRVTRQMRGKNSLPVTTELISAEQAQSTQFHRWWATQAAITDEATAKLVEAAAATIERQGPNVFLSPDGEIDPYSALDAYELDLLAKRIGRTTSYSNGLQDGDKALTRKGTEVIDPRLELRKLALYRGMSPLLPGERTRPRVIAEIALEEAELLALRLPGQANWLFGRADSLFIDSRDWFGALRATLGAALAEASLDSTTAAQNIDRVQALYGSCHLDLLELKDLGLSLPDWNDIQPLEILGMKDHPWFDWLLRIARLKVWAYEPQPGPMTEQINQVIADCYGDKPQFDLLPGGGVKEQATAVTVRGPKWQYWLGAMLFFALVIGMTVIGIKWLFDNPAVLRGGLYTVGASVVSLLAYFKYFMPFMSRGTFILRRPRVLLQADSTGEQLLVRFEADPPRSAFLRMVKAFGMALPPTELAARPEPGYGSYHEVAPGFALEPLKRLSKSLSWGKLPVMLIVDRTLEHYAWEAPFWIASRSSAMSASIQPVRSGELLPPPLGLTEWATSSVHVACQSSLGNTFAHAWQKMDSPVDVVTSSVFVPPAEGQSLRVMHLIGVSTPTRSGPVFTITRPYEDERPTSISFSEATISPAIVIVQEEPAERIRRLDIDREQTALTRGWAAEIFRNQGLHTVILIPPLPLALARLTVAALAKGLRGKQPPDIFKLLNAVTDARKEITNFRPPAAGPDEADLRADMKASEVKQALQELSLEITVFSRSIYFKAEGQLGGDYIGFAAT